MRLRYWLIRLLLPRADRWELETALDMWRDTIEESVEDALTDGHREELEEDLYVVQNLIRRLNANK